MVHSPVTVEASSASAGFWIMKVKCIFDEASKPVKSALTSALTIVYTRPVCIHNSSFLRLRCNAQTIFPKGSSKDAESKRHHRHVDAHARSHSANRSSLLGIEDAVKRRRNGSFH